MQPTSPGQDSSPPQWRRKGRRSKTCLRAAALTLSSMLAAACAATVVPDAPQDQQPRAAASATRETVASTPSATDPRRAESQPSSTAALDYARYGLPADGSVGANEDLAMPRMSQEDALAALHDDGLIFVDTRQEWEFRRGHIPGARKIQAFVEDHLLAELPPDKTIVIYCACSAEQTSARAAVILKAMGYERVYALKDGWHAWVDEGRPVERSLP